MAGFASLNRNPAPAAPNYRGAYGGGPGGPGSPVAGVGYGTVGQSARAARYAMDTVGMPNFGELLKGTGGFQGVTEFGNAGAAGRGADFAKNELQGFKGHLNEARTDYAHPTQSGGFQAGMNLAREQTAGATADIARRGAEASQRRGYSGGYDPRAADIDRMRALSEAGFAGVKQARGEALSQFGGEMQGYQSALDAYKGLTQTQAELPTKMLSALAPYYSSILGAGSDFFRASMGGVQSDDANRRSAAERLRQQMAGPGGVHRIG